MTVHKHPPGNACSRCGRAIIYGDDGYPIHTDEKMFDPIVPGLCSRIDREAYIEGAVLCGTKMGCRNVSPPGKCLGCSALLLHVLPKGHAATESWLKRNGYDGVHFYPNKEFPIGAVLCWPCIAKRGGFDAGEGAEE